jgi:hypothetical protein
VVSNEGFRIQADLPGVDPDSLDVSVSESALVITGSKAEHVPQDGEVYWRKECCCGDFARTVALPEEADLDKATASFTNNVLSVSIPRKPEESLQGHRLTIQSRNGAAFAKSESVSSHSAARPASKEAEGAEHAQDRSAKPLARSDKSSASKPKSTQAA